VVDYFFRFSAVYLIFVLGAAAAAVCFYFWKKDKKLGSFIFLWVAGTTVFSYTVKILINWLMFRPRPFAALGGVHQLVLKSPFDNSFPSGHATAAFAIALPLLFFLLQQGKNGKIFGIIFLISATLVAFSRIASGIHYPIDILGGVLVALLVSLSSARILKRLFIADKRG